MAGNRPDRTTRAAIIEAPGVINVGDRPYPVVVEPTDAVVRVVLTCVCGGDLWQYRGDSSRPFPQDGMRQSIAGVEVLVGKCQEGIGSSLPAGACDFEHLAMYGSHVPVHEPDRQRSSSGSSPRVSPGERASSMAGWRRVSRPPTRSTALRCSRTSTIARARPRPPQGVCSPASRPCVGSRSVRDAASTGHVGGRGAASARHEGGRRVASARRSATIAAPALRSRIRTCERGHVVERSRGSKT